MFLNKVYVNVNIGIFFFIFREKLVSMCIDVCLMRIFIIYGMDFMIEIVVYLFKRVIDKIIVIIGVFFFETFKVMDVDFNVGFVLGVFIMLLVIGVFIVMNG